MNKGKKERREDGRKVIERRKEEKMKEGQKERREDGKGGY